MRRTVLATLFLAGAFAAPLPAQRSMGRWSLGIHGGADLSDEHTLKLLGAQIGFGFPGGLRILASGTSVIEEPGTQLFTSLGLQWSPLRARVAPYLGGGIAMGYQEVGPFSETDWGWLAQAGLRVHFRGIVPFAELRLQGFNGTATQVLVGFEAGVY